MDDRQPRSRRAGGSLPVPQVLDELRTVLLRPSFRSFITVEEVDELVRAITAAADHEEHPVVQVALTRDPSDDYLVALGIGSRSPTCWSAVIPIFSTLDNLAKPPVRISSPRDLLDELEHPIAE